MIEITGPDGSIIRFPDGTDEATINNVLRQTFGAPQAPTSDISPDMAARMSALLTPEGQAARVAEERAGEGFGERALRRLNGLRMGIANGGTFGFGDEAEGALLGGLLGATPQPGGGVDFFDYDTPVGERYAGMRDLRRQRSDRAEAAAPGFYMAGDIGGGVATATASLPMAAGRSLGGTALRGAGLGTVEGALIGAGNADGEGLLGHSLVGAGFGAGLGAAAPFVTAGARAVADPLVGAVQALRGQPYVARAGRHMEAVLGRSGLSPDDAAKAIADAAADGQTEFTLADALGNAGQRSLAGIARQPGAGRQAIVEALTSRQAGQGERVAGFATNALGTSDTAAQRRAAMEGARASEADGLYSGARSDAGPVNLNGTLEVIDSVLRRDPILGDSSLSQGPMGQRLAALRDRLATGSEQLIDFDSVLAIKTDLWRTMQRNSDAARDLMPAYRALDAALEEASAGYRAANDTFRRRSLDLEGIDAGMDAARPGTRYEDALGGFRGMSPEGQDAFRVGLGDRALARLEAQPPGADASRQFTTPRMSALMGEAALDPALFGRQIDREGIMFETRRQALGGSQTADNLADQADSNAVGVIASLLAGNITGATGSLTRQGISAGMGMNEATRTLIAQALLSREPQTALGPLLEAAGRSAERSRAGEAFLRHLGYSTAF